MVFSRPIRSETKPKKGRVRPLVRRSIESASGSAATPQITALVIPNSAAKVAICDVTISPEWTSASSSRTSARIPVCAACRRRVPGLGRFRGRGCRRPAFSPRAASRPTSAKTRRSGAGFGRPAPLSEAVIGNVVTIAPMP